MSSHKIPSNLDAEEKLVGFLSLKQFLFVLGGFALGFVAYTFAKASFLLAIPFLPFVITLFVLGLYQRPDQPVEVFLLSWIRFKSRPKVRIWNQEGYEKHVIVSAPKKEVIDYTKGLRHSDILNKFQVIGTTLDSRGWSTKGVADNSGDDPIPTQTERLLSLEEESSKNIRSDYIQPQPRTWESSTDLQSYQNEADPLQATNLKESSYGPNSINSGFIGQQQLPKQDNILPTRSLQTAPSSSTQTEDLHINPTETSDTTFSLR